MSLPFAFTPARIGPEAMAFRDEVRAFLEAEIAAGSFDPGEARPLARVDRAFSRKLGARGWIGMTWPKAVRRPRAQRSSTVTSLTEELLVRAATAPILRRTSSPTARAARF